MPQEISLDLDPSLIRPLGGAQNEFLQVLLTAFRLRPQRKGFQLEVEFDFDSPAVCLRLGKAHIRQRLDRDRGKRYDRALRQIFVGDAVGDFVHDDPAFPFRFGNGGTLPVICMDNAD